MADPQMDELDLAALFAAAKLREHYDELAALLGEPSPSSVPPTVCEVEEGPTVDASAALPSTLQVDGAAISSPARPPTPARSQPSNPVKRTGYAWEGARHLLPEPIVTLTSRYPALGMCQHTEFGLVVMAAYLEDTERRIRRNLKLGNHMFFDAPELDSFAPDLTAFKCRVVVKTILLQPGMVIRFWENTPNGDLPDRGSYVVRERGFERQGGKR
jgi:hypothetical protein